MLQDYLPYPTAKENVCEGINLTVLREWEKSGKPKKSFCYLKISMFNYDYEWKRPPSQLGAIITGFNFQDL